MTQATTGKVTLVSDVSMNNDMKAICELFLSSHFPPAYTTYVKDYKKSNIISCEVIIVFVVVTKKHTHFHISVSYRHIFTWVL